MIPLGAIPKIFSFRKTKNIFFVFWNRFFKNYIFKKQHFIKKHLFFDNESKILENNK